MIYIQRLTIQVKYISIFLFSMRSLFTWTWWGNARWGGDWKQILMRDNQSNKDVFKSYKHKGPKGQSLHWTNRTK